MRMGMPSHRHHNHHLPRRRSVEDTTRRTSMDSIDPQDFSDVFGGPPRTVTSRKFSGDFTRPSETFYQEIFKPPQFVSHVNKGSGPSLPPFRVPANGERFYGDVFGGEVEVAKDEGRLSRERSWPNSTAKSQSKSNSSSVLSSEELSPLGRQVAGDDVTLSLITSRLRPINVPCRWNSATMRPEEQPINPVMPPFSSNSPLFSADTFDFRKNDHDDNLKGSYFKVSEQISSPETTSFEPSSYRSVKISVHDLELDSPSSPVSSLCQEAETKADVELNTSKEEMEQEDDEVASSYVIEINSDRRNGTAEAVSLDEAIAWAKEKFHAQCVDGEKNKDCAATEEDEPNTTQLQVLDEGRKQSPTAEIELLDEDVRLWSSGNESNIRVLLSTLHHILWPNCGWHAIPIMSLIEGSQVKKAYQKARLCLHPDKMQQRGATLHQKYVAEKAFSILQEAWSAFLSKEAVFN